MSLTVEKCLQAWTNSLRQMKAKADIVFFGDSLTYYGDFSKVFPDKIVCNLGLRGDTIQGMIDRVEQVKMLEPRVVYLMAGINDVTCSNEMFLELYQKLILSIKDCLPNVDLIVQTLLPVNSVDFNISCNSVQIINANYSIRALAWKYKLKYVDLFEHYNVNNVLPKEITTDGIHLWPKGYEKWMKLLKE